MDLSTPPDQPGNTPPDNQPTAFTGPRWMTLAQVAALTGLSVEAVRQRAKRGKLRAVRSNEDRMLRIQVTAADLAALRPLSPTVPPVNATDHSHIIKTLEDAIAALREAAGRDAARLAAAEAQLVEARAQAAEAATRQHQAEAQAAAGEGRAAAEGEARQRAEAEAAALRRELEGWSSGGPLARAIRAAFWRRG